MTEVWRKDTSARVRGWRLSAGAAVRLCCRAPVPVLLAAAQRSGRRGSIRASVEVSGPRRCRRQD
ncbi:hypothetical protein [Saccharomonospora xinjiangensis]|uniref:Uncharacterized protein n=1 Tax=Saccharomonospora xinjiangensis XJ-54 TaxID=882086 RepID=I0UWY4_9PSEU|nr:hypothetical protein [Saccharomonospora xinjiangensis]EID52387.1 hypothetical protein SacxiDRAFT_0104 [Saccharomonospora xinjiangensis XJ-54]